MQHFVTNRIKTTSPASVGETLGAAKETNRSLDEILDGMRSQKQVKTAASVGSPVAQETACLAESGGAVEDACSGGKAVETACGCSQASAGEEEVASVNPLLEEEARNLFALEDPMKEQIEQPLFASKKPMILKVAKKADFRPWSPEDIVKAWGNHGSQEKCVAASKGLTNDPKAYCYLLQTASEEATNLLKTASKANKTEKVAAPKGMFKKLASLPEKDSRRLYDYWKGLYGDEYAKAMLEDYVK
jgi:hypothetical protein